VFCGHFGREAAAWQAASRGSAHSQSDRTEMTWSSVGWIHRRRAADNGDDLVVAAAGGGRRWSVDGDVVAVVVAENGEQKGRHASARARGGMAAVARPSTFQIVREASTTVDLTKRLIHSDSKEFSKEREKS